MAALPGSAELPVANDDLCSAYQRVRKASERICEPLMIEDYAVQTMPDVSPPRWQLANEQLGRIEMHLVSQQEQAIQIGDQQFHFATDETIHTESSY